MAKRILSLFRNLFRKRDIEQALDDELRSMLEILTQEKIEQGLSQATARREALIEIGGIEQVKEGVREVRAGHYVEILAGDIRYALRQLRRNQSFTAIAVLTLALGIGATTATHNLPLRVAPALIVRDPLSHRVLSGEELPRQRFVDDSHSGLGSVVVFREETPAHQRCLQRRQIARAPTDAHRILRGLLWREELLDPHLGFPTVGDQPNGTGILRVPRTAEPRDAELLAMNAEPVKVIVGPGEGDLDEAMEVAKGIVCATTKRRQIIGLMPRIHT